MFSIYRKVTTFFKGFKGSLIKMLFFILMGCGIALILVAAFKFKGYVLTTFITLGLATIGFSILRLTINTIGSNAIEKHEAKELREKLKEMQQKNIELERKFSESNQQPLKIRDIHPILDMGILEVDFELTKYFDQQYKKEGKKLKKTYPKKQERGDLRFIGGLSANFCARYGFDLLSIKVKEDNIKGRFYVSGVDPVFQGTRGFPKLKWQSSIMLGFSLISQCWETRSELAEFENECREEFREILEDRLKSGPEELNFIKNPIQNHIRRLIQGLFAPKGFTVEFAEETQGKDYTSLTKYLSNKGIEGIENIK